MPSLNSIQEWNWISVLIVLILAGSVIQGVMRGASGSARQLLALVMEGVVTIASLFVAWQLMKWLSPVLRDWLIARNIQIPNEEISAVKQMYYTIVTGLRDFTLMRSGLLFVIGYLAVKNLLYGVVLSATRHLSLDPNWGSAGRRGGPGLTSGATGGLIGGLMGAGRAIMLIAVLFMFTSLFPQTRMTGYIEGSNLYQKGAKEIITPITGDWISKQLPVFTRSVQDEFSNILQRKYEVIDARIPDDIAGAAKEVTASSKTDEEKARALYQWVGSRVRYDWDKVRQYEDNRVWKEQTPEDTFKTHLGVCIDYSRLYAVMARSVGLDVKVVTGLGYDGQGSYGPHAWNEVYLAGKHAWVPLDTTWVSSGGNWFNPPNFYDTHIKDA